MVTKTYVIEDCLLANFDRTDTFNLSGVVFNHIYTMPSEMDCVIEADIKSSNASQFGLVLKESNNQTNNQYIRVGVEGSNVKGSTITSNQYTHSSYLETKASNNVSFPVKIEYKNGVISGYVDNGIVETHSKTFTPLYVMILAWNKTGRTVTVSNLKIKPLMV